MSETHTAKLFKNGASQAVRLPAEFRFPGDKVYIRRDESTGDVILSESPGAEAWKSFFDFVQGFEVPSEFMRERPLNKSSKARNPFEEPRK